MVSHQNDHRIGRLAVIAATVAATAAVLSGCSSPVSTVAATHAATASMSPTPSPTTVLGTREKPFPTGMTGTYDPTQWTFTFLSTNGNAWPTVQPLDTYNVAPAAGTSDVLATVKIDAGQKSNPADPSSSVTYNYVGSDGNTYPTGGCGTLGDQSIDNSNEMYAGATKTVLLCAQVPTGAVPGGTWAVAENYVNRTTPTIFFQGA